MLDTLKRLYSDQDKLREALLSANTRKGYHYDWRAFARWCTSMHLVDLPATPETVGLFVMAELLRKQKVSTVTRRVAVIVHEHKAAGLHRQLVTACTSCCAAPAGCGVSAHAK